MTATEAQAVATVLGVIAGERDSTAESLIEAFEYLDERAAKALQVGYVVHDSHGLDGAAHRLVQHNEDAR